MIEPSSELVIDYELVRNNIQIIKSNLPANCKIMGIIKSNAYGHDLEKATKALDDAIDGYGVVRLEEALKIRETSLKPILAMQGVYSSDAYDALKQNNIWSVVHSISQLPLAKQYQDDLLFWIKVNTGMNRLGIGLDELDQFQSLLKSPNVLMTHLACADNPEDELNSIQFKNFEHAWDQVKNDMQRSVLNSAGVFNFPNQAYDWVRPGIAMYGGIDFPGLKTAMTFRSQIISIQSLNKNERIGYGGRVEIKKPSKVAIVYCGYADGFPQTAIDGTSVIVNNCQSQIIGRVSMDLISIDVTEIPDCKIGDWCELWSPDLSILENTKKNHLISYELMTKMSQRVKRQYLNI
jgi:alanine racemase|tara:strand:- start:866 stop:1915 length:1050 start_codon:yes stop_codon:yes gene_type:complete